MSYNNHLRLFLLAGCAALIAVNCAQEDEKPTLTSDAEQRASDLRGGKRDGPGAERKKKWSGISYASQTYVQLTAIEFFSRYSEVSSVACCRTGCRRSHRRRGPRRQQ